MIREHKKNKHIFHCDVCNVDVQNTPKGRSDHIESDDHQRQTRLENEQHRADGHTCAANQRKRNGDAAAAAASKRQRAKKVNEGHCTNMCGGGLYNHRKQFKTSFRKIILLLVQSQSPQSQSPPMFVQSQSPPMLVQSQSPPMFVQSFCTIISTIHPNATNTRSLVAGHGRLQIEHQWLAVCYNYKHPL